MHQKSFPKNLFRSNLFHSLNSKILKLIFGMLLSGCSATHVDPILEKKHSTDTGPLSTTSPDFASVKKDVFKRCTICHEQYKTFRGITRELEAIGNAVALNRMPKSGGPLSPEQKDILNRWIQNGAPEFANQPAQTIEFPPLEPNWNSIYDGIIAPKCLACHNPRGQAKFLDLSSRDSIFSQRDRKFGGVKFINLENIESSYLVQILIDEEEPMPPIWSNIKVLNDEELRIFKQWLSLSLP